MQYNKNKRKYKYLQFKLNTCVLKTINLKLNIKPLKIKLYQLITHP